MASSYDRLSKTSHAAHITSLTVTYQAVNTNSSFDIVHDSKNIQTSPAEIIRCSQTPSNSISQPGDPGHLKLKTHSPSEAKRKETLHQNLYYLYALKQGMNALKLTSVLWAATWSCDVCGSSCPAAACLTIQFTLTVQLHNPTAHTNRTHHTYDVKLKGKFNHKLYKCCCNSQGTWDLRPTRGCQPCWSVSSTALTQPDLWGSCFGFSPSCHDLFLLGRWWV